MANGLRKLIKHARKSFIDYSQRPYPEETPQLNYKGNVSKKYHPKLRLEELEERIAP